MLKCLIFDWHGVLDETKFELLLDVLSRLSNLEKGEMKLKIKNFERDYAKGIIEPDTFWSMIKESLNLTKDQLEEAQKSILTIKPYKELWNMLPDFKDAYALSILSDCPLDKVEIITREANLSFSNITDFSAEKHLLKDSYEFFLNHVRKLNVQTNECLYIDDSEKHILTAKSLGFNTCHFTNVSDLTKSLETFN